MKFSINLKQQTMRAIHEMKRDFGRFRIEEHPIHGLQIWCGEELIATGCDRIHHDQLQVLCVGANHILHPAKQLDHGDFPGRDYSNMDLPNKSYLSGD